MQLYLIRHGQSEGNMVTYDVPDGDLTPLGRAQAEETARRLTREGIDLIIASPLRRALQTALPLLVRTGVPLEVWRDLAEVRWGPPHRFLDRSGVEAVCPGARCEEGYPEEGFDLGGETDRDAHRRALRVAERLKERFAATGMRVAVFAHATFNSFLLSALIGRPLGPGFVIEQENGCINRVRIAPEEVRLIAVNETAHLPELSR